MKEAHTHPEVEINYVMGDRMTYRHGGVLHHVNGGTLAIFWAGVPHQTVHAPDPSRGIWVYLPLPWLLQWKLPKEFAGRLLAGSLITHRMGPEMITSWPDKFSSNDEDVHLLLQLELRTLLTKIALSLPTPRTTQRGAGTPSMEGGDCHIATITSYLSRHYMDAFSTEQLAADVGLKPVYLKQLFQRQCGISIGEYLTRLRISHAQRLLSTTDLNVLEIALECGFGSSSRFYSAFSRFGHSPPLDFRRRQQAPPV